MSTDTLTQHASITCKNCGADAQGNYCQQCGQATHLHVPSAREFLHEFVSHYVALEGKLWKTLALLLVKPGVLTREYIEGRRVRYLEPLRLYLTFSIIFFALFKFSDIAVINLGEPDPAAAVAVATDQPAPGKMVAGTPEHAAELNRSVRPVVAQLTSFNATLGQKVQHFLDLPRRTQEQALTRAFFSYTPYAIFALMPVFALYLKVLYLGTGRRYGEHFLFALHSNAFAFLMFSLILLLPSSLGLVEFGVFLWLLFYLPTAMRRVYGGSRRSTFLRWIVLMTLHFLSLIVAIVLASALAMMG
jgi:hypothetical protein